MTKREPCVYSGRLYIQQSLRGLEHMRRSHMKRSRGAGQQPSRGGGHAQEGFTVRGESGQPNTRCHLATGGNRAGADPERGRRHGSQQHVTASARQTGSSGARQPQDSGGGALA